MRHPRDEKTQVWLSDEEDFIDLIERLAPDSRRVVNLLLRKVAIIEEKEGERAALTLIDDVSSIITRPLTTH